MVSRELLEAVIGKAYVPRIVEKIEIDDGNVTTYYTCSKKPMTCLGYEINIYRFAHMCKKWALANGWVFQVRTGNTLSVIDILNDKNKELHTTKQITANAEPEAIFKACEWVLNRKEK
jgi:hypothetical protein